MSETTRLGIELEAEGGAIPLDSRFYVERPCDAEFRTAVSRGDGIVLVKGARQMGKTSLLARGIQEARAMGARVVLTDFQALGPEQVATPESLCLALAEVLAEQLDLDTDPEETWEPQRNPTTNLERFLRREVLGTTERFVVWALDEVDRLFTTGYSDEIFATFRSWHNKRALEPEGPWSRLTLAISFATEAHLFIRDLNQSPFNTGTRATLRDFTFTEVMDLNERYGMPLRSREEQERFHRLFCGHPFLSRRALHELALNRLDLAALETEADRPDGLFADHLQRMHLLLTHDPELLAAARLVVAGEPCPTQSSFLRLRGAGVVSGEDSVHARPRCELYARYFRYALAPEAPSLNLDGHAGL